MIRKAIYTLLDILLVMGALTAVATIDGGKWITKIVENPQNYQAEYSDFYLMQQSIDANRQSQTQKSTNEILPQTGSNCRNVTLQTIPEWDEAQLMLSSSYGGGNVLYAPGTLVNICDNK